jgi:hypothetical protein
VKIDPTEVVGHVLSATLASSPLEIEMRLASEDELQEFLVNLDGIQKLDPHVKAGEHRLKDWADGWAENLAAFRSQGNAENLVPKYFGKYPEIRLNGKLFIDAANRAELTLLRTLQVSALAYAKRATPFKGVCEFGAGTGHNLLAFSVDKTLEYLRGYEWSWSGVACINEIGKRYDSHITGHFFDYFAPGLQPQSDLAECCAITVASLEQIGTGFRPFLEFLKRGKPAVIINIEPIRELMGTGPLAELSMTYARKRNYLAGYYDYLKNLQSAGVIEILLEQESLLGSKFINGYGTLIWRWT